MILYWGFCGLFGLLALIVAPWQKLAALIIIGLGVVLALALLSREDQIGRD